MTSDPKKKLEDWRAARAAWRQVHASLDRLEIILRGGNPDDPFEIFRSIFKK
jgi:hypothetical protein